MQREINAVEAVFTTRELPPLPAFLDENGLEPCEDHPLVLKRSFTSAGANRQFINGSPATLAVLASLGEKLVELHREHERKMHRAHRELKSNRRLPSQTPRAPAHTAPILVPVQMHPD